MIRHRCPICDEAQEHSPATAGMTLPCKHCRSPIEVPKDSTTADRAAGAAAAAPVAWQAPAAPARPLVDTISGWVGAHTGDGPAPPMNAGKRVMFTLLGLFLLAIFGGVGAYGAYSFVESRRSRSWPSTEGVVEHSGVAEKVSRDSRGRRRREYSAVVRYAYTAGGQKHEAARLAFGDGQTYSFLARRLAEQYKPQQKVTVYYDPADFGSAVLRREVLFGGYVMVAVGVVVGFIGLRLVLMALAPGAANSRWAPWSRRVTWPDVPLLALGAVGLVLWVPMLFGL